MRVGLRSHAVPGARLRGPEPDQNFVAILERARLDRPGGLAIRLADTSYRCGDCGAVCSALTIHPGSSRRRSEREIGWFCSRCLAGERPASWSGRDEEAFLEGLAWFRRRALAAMPPGPRAPLHRVDFGSCFF